MTIKKPKRGFFYPKPTDLSNVDGLVAAYNMQPNGRTLTDISGNGNNATIMGDFYTSQEGYGNADTALAQTGSIALEGDFSIAFRVKWLANSGISNFFRQAGSGTSNVWIFRSSTSLILDQNSGGSAETSIGTVTIGSEEDFVITYNNSTGEVKMYRNGESVSVFSTYNPSGSRTASFYIGNATSSYALKDLLKDMRIYNKILSVQEVKDYHNSFAKQVVLQEDFSDAPADGTSIVPREWEKVSGAWKIGELTSQDSALKHLDKGSKYLENVTAGIIAIPSKSAYGTWEFDLYKGAGGNDIIIFPIADTSSILKLKGYEMMLTASEIFFVNIKIVNGMDITANYSASSYIQNNTWYRIKMTRTTTGVFTVLIKGGNFTPTTGYDGWTLVSTSGGYGTNPVTDTAHTTSNYFVLDLDVGDRITNIEITQGVIAA